LLPVAAVFAVSVQAGTADVDKLNKLMHKSWEQHLRMSPLAANSTGDTRYRDLLDDVSEENLDRQLDMFKGLSKELASINPDDLDEQSRINYEVFSWLLRNELKVLQSDWRYVRFNSFEGWHSSFASYAGMLPFRKKADYDAYLKRLSAFPRYADQQISLMRKGIAKGLTHPCNILEGYQDAIEGYIFSDVTTSSLYAPFKAMPETVSTADQDALRKKATSLLADDVNAAYAAYAEFFKKEYLPKCRKQAGVSSVKGGADLYDMFVKYYTTLDTDAETVHKLGLSEVERILAEMHEVKKASGFEGDFDAFLHFLRTDKQFYPDNAEEYVDRVARISKSIDGKLPAYFSLLPRTPYGISIIPEAIAEKTTTAYYQPGAADGSRAGQYFINTSRLSSRPYYELPALSLHEAVPGHHLQIALQGELKELPMFRRFYGFHAYVEGWALYTEFLGIEMGMYNTPYEHFGRLTYEMWRATRLVVDTGIHAKGWTRQQAIDFMARHTALSLHNITAEVDRYISWPGQALAYKHGELKIRALRKKAEEALGEKFDLREFHTAVLTIGAVPLKVLEAHINRWINEQKA
jgi:uncharacterized protein (DUF885 family)